MRSSPDAQYALHIGYHQGVFSACLFWLVASFTASYFGVWASWVKWAMVVLRLVYLLRPKYIDHYPTVDPSKSIDMVSRLTQRVGEDDVGRKFTNVIRRSGFFCPTRRLPAHDSASKHERQCHTFRKRMEDHVGIQKLWQ